MNPRLFGRCALACLLLGLALVALDRGMDEISTHVLLQGRIFEPHPVLGWRPIPNRSLVRLNPDGRPWRIQTNEHGFRGAPAWAGPAGRRVLVLGDSLAFGQGIDAAHRFDSILAREVPDLAVVNAAVMGYGTDQQFLAGERWLGDLRPGDLLLLMTNSTDYYEVLDRRSYGRPKPLFELVAGGLRAQPPAVGVRERLRDWSPLGWGVAGLWNRVAPLPEPVRTDDDAARGLALYRDLVRHFAAEPAARGVRVVIARAGDAAVRRRAPALFDQTFADICAWPGVACVALDSVLHGGTLQRDGHWNEAGHAAVAGALRREAAGGTAP